MPQLSTIVGACKVPHESPMPIQSIQFSLAVDFSSVTTYNYASTPGPDDILSQAVEYSTTGTIIWGRIPYKADVTPGAGTFQLIQGANQCCCRCRYVAFGGPPENGFARVDADGTLTRTTAKGSGGMSTSEPVSDSALGLFWNGGDAPCREANSPYQNNPEFGARFLTIFADVDAEYTASGSSGAHLSGTDIYATANPCEDEQNYTLIIQATLNRTTDTGGGNSTTEEVNATYTLQAALT